MFDRGPRAAADREELVESKGRIFQADVRQQTAVSSEVQGAFSRESFSEGELLVRERLGVRELRV